MTENERITMLRKSLGMTMEKFGECIGITKNAISNIENGRRGVTAQLKTSICNTFRIRREWLETGELPMEEPRTRTQILIDYIDSCMDQPDSFKARFAEAMAKLSDEQWVQLAEIFTTMTEKTQEP